MNLKFKEVFITPEDEAFLSAAVNPKQHPEAYRWLSYVRDELYREWKSMPNGSHLKSAYQSEVWSWNDEDLSN